MPKLKKTKFNRKLVLVIFLLVLIVISQIILYFFNLSKTDCLSQNGIYKMMEVNGTNVLVCTIKIIEEFSISEELLVKCINNTKSDLINDSSFLEFEKKCFRYNGTISQRLNDDCSIFGICVFPNKLECGQWEILDNTCDVLN